MQRGLDRYPYPSTHCKALGASRASMRLQHHPHEAKPRHLVWGPEQSASLGCKTTEGAIASNLS